MLEHTLDLVFFDLRNLVHNARFHISINLLASSYKYYNLISWATSLRSVIGNGSNEEPVTFWL